MKVTLLNTQTGKNEDFEPVDAREALAGKDSIYAVPKESKDAVALKMAADGTADINVPQLQGADAELHQGNNEDKYARQNVVKAQAGDPGTARGDEVEGEVKAKPTKKADDKK